MEAIRASKCKEIPLRHSVGNLKKPKGEEKIALVVRVRRQTQIKERIILTASLQQKLTLK